MVIKTTSSSLLWYASVTTVTVVWSCNYFDKDSTLGCLLLLDGCTITGAQQEVDWLLLLSVYYCGMWILIGVVVLNYQC